MRIVFLGAPGSGTYRDLVEAGRRGDVDVVYLATPHPQHHDLALAAIEAGTPLLVEGIFSGYVFSFRDVTGRVRAEAEQIGAVFLAKPVEPSTLESQVHL